MFNFDHLNDVVITAPEKAVKASAEKAEKPKISKNPEGYAIRVFANGNIYPSQLLVDTLGLEYPTTIVVEGATEPIRNALDVFKFSKLLNAPTMAQDCIMIAAVPKNLPKVDLFGGCKYNAAGEPISSVMSQGGGVFGEQLIPMIKEVYGLEIPKGTYLDLAVRLDIAPTVPEIVYVPKTIDRGPKKGKDDVARRENISIHPLVPIVILEELPAVTDEEATQLTSDETVATDIMASEQVVTEIPEVIVEAAAPVVEPVAPVVQFSPMEVPEKPAYVAPNLGNAPHEPIIVYPTSM